VEIQRQHPRKAGQQCGVEFFTQYFVIRAVATAGPTALEYMFILTA
jgi:hypothetical protein